MRIVHVTPVYPPYKSGMGYVASSQSQWLVKLGHEVTAITVKSEQGKVKNEKVNGVEVKRLRPTFQFGNGAWVPQLLWLLRSYDVVQLHYPFFGAAEWVFLARRFRLIKKLVVYYHMDAQLQGILGFVGKVYERIVLPLLLSSADAVLVSSLDYALASRNASSFFSYRKKGKMEPKKKVVEVPIGIDVARFQVPGVMDQGKELKKKLGIEDNQKVILFVGGMDAAHYFKGVDVLLKAHKVLLDEFENNCDRKNPRIGMDEKMCKPPVLVLVGDGDKRTGFEQLARELGIEKKVHFAGRVSDDELPVYYHMCDVFVLPSINRAEAFGIVLLEALACSKPVIASDLPGVRSVVGDSGIVVKSGDSVLLADAIGGILNDTDVILNSTFPHKYTLKDTVHTLIDIY